LLFGLLACDRKPAPAATSVAQPAARTDLRVVAQRRLDELKAETRRDPLAPPDEELSEHVAGLLDTLAGTDEGLKRIARDELKSLGPRTTPLLAARIMDDAAPAAVQMAAAQALGDLDAPEAAEALLVRLEEGRKRVDPSPWLRAHCAWRLGDTTQDWIVPRLLLDLRYELDNETAIYLARTTARFGNFSGLDALYVVAQQDKREEVRSRANATLAEIARDAGFDDPAALYNAWFQGGEGELPEPMFSKAHAREVWTILQHFAEWNLRTVDDGRFVLSRESSKITPLLVEALDDESRYIRVHAAQCLERMTARARAAGPRLLELIDDPEMGDQVMIALGSIHYAPAEAALIERVKPTHLLEVRMAATRALKAMASPASIPALRELLDPKEPIDLRVEAQCALVACAPLDVDASALGFLHEQLTARLVDSAAPEAAIEQWLVARESDPAVAKALEGWRAIAPYDPNQRVAERAAFLKDFVAAQK